MPDTATQLAYSPAIAALVDAAPADDLGPGAPHEAARARLAALDDATMWPGRRVTDRAMADACRSALWLRYHFLDESHRVSQDIATTTGSFWHGIMHRREGDFGNAKYWFHRVGRHPVLGSLATALRGLATEADDAVVIERLTAGNSWDCDRFVDLCEATIRRRGNAGALCLKLQDAEWRELFDYCYRAAVSAQ